MATADGSRRTGNKVGSNKGIARMRHEDKQAEAATRQIERESRSPEAQLRLISERPGDSRKERSRLRKQKVGAA